MPFLNAFRKACSSSDFDLFFYRLINTASTIAKMMSPASELQIAIETTFELS